MSKEMLRDMLQSRSGDLLMNELFAQQKLAEVTALNGLASEPMDKTRYRAGIIDGIGQCINLLAKLRKGE